MTIGYLVFAYRNPRLLARTIQALSHPDAQFFIHIDAKSDVTPFLALAAPNVVFLENRETVYWAEFSGVSAILKLIRRGLAAPSRCDYFVLLSGSEFPLRSAGYIHDFLHTHRGTEFIDLVRIPAPEVGRTETHLNVYRPPSTQPIRRACAKVIARCGLARRDVRAHFGDLAPYGGHTWWTLTREACEFILNFIPQHPRVAAFFQNSPQPEEFFFHTILGNSTFRSQVRRNLLFEDWTAGGRRPATINEVHVASFEAQTAVVLNDRWGSGEVLFARKLSDENLHLVDRLEGMIAEKDHLVRSGQRVAPPMPPPRKSQSQLQ